ncbi:MAG: hypothetical protein MJ250_06420 [Alphaproteobacteria bacterium]|nr:hypothetical protein [Alphaproteobacteria bacterium]
MVEKTNKLAQQLVSKIKNQKSTLLEKLKQKKEIQYTPQYKNQPLHYDIYPERWVNDR